MFVPVCMVHSEDQVVTLATGGEIELIVTLLPRQLTVHTPLSLVFCSPKHRTFTYFQFQMISIILSPIYFSLYTCTFPIPLYCLLYTHTSPYLNELSSRYVYFPLYACTFPSYSMKYWLHELLHMTHILRVQDWNHNFKCQHIFTVFSNECKFWNSWF